MRHVWKLLLSAAFAAATSAKAQAPLALDGVLDIAAFEERQPITRSPDGRYIAGAVRRASRAAALAEPNTRYFVRTGAPVNEALGDDIWVIDLRTGDYVDITVAQGSSWGPAWSPDGRHLAFYSDRDGAARLWVWDRETRSTRRVSDRIVRPFWSFETPKWFPDGNRLLVKLLPEGMTLEQARSLLPEPVRGQAPDGADPAVPAAKVFASHDSLLPARSDSDRAPSPVSAGRFLNRTLGDLAIVDLPSGRTRTVAENVHAQNYWPSPDGRFVMYTRVRWHETAGRGTVLYSLIVHDASTGAARTLATDALRDYGITVSWAPTGHRIAFADTAGLVVVGAERSGARLEHWKELARISRPGAQFRSDYTPPLWSADGSRLYVAANDSVWEATWSRGTLRSLGTLDGHQITGIVGDFVTGQVWGEADRRAVYGVVRSRSTLRMGFARFSVTSPDVRLAWSADIAMAGPRFGAAPATHSTVAFIAQNAARPEEIWIFDPASDSARRVSELHRDIGRYRVGLSRLVSWRSTPGDSLRGVLVLPPSYEEGQRVPLVVRVYPGSNPSRALNRFGAGGVGIYNAQLLATRGYAVLLPDIPPSRGRPVDAVAESVLPAVERIIEMGIADPERIGVTGFSGGGFSTIALLTRSKLFAAAIAEQGGASLFSDYLHMRSDGSSPGVARVEGYGDGMGGPPWGDKLGAYYAQSPIFHLDRITAPVLLIHGDADEIVPPTFSGQIFVGLRRLGKPVVLALYPGEGHGATGWSRTNMYDAWERTAAWWQRWLGER